MAVTALNMENESAAPTANLSDERVQFYEHREMLGTVIRLTAAILPEHALEVRVDYSILGFLSIVPCFLDFIRGCLRPQPQSSEHLVCCQHLRNGYF